MTHSSILINDISNNNIEYNNCINRSIVALDVSYIELSKYLLIILDIDIFVTFIKYYFLKLI